MSYPNPTFLTKASNIKKTRKTRTIIAVVVLVVIALLTTFVLWGAHMQSIYAEKYPEMVGAATRETTTIARRTSETTETSEETTETTPPETTVLAPIIATEETTTVAEVTEQVNVADPFIEEEPFYFKTSYPLQTITHEQRDVALDVLKQQVQDYINSHGNERISFRYVNLNSNETMGINDLNPILPSGAFALPVELVYYQRLETGYLYELSTVTYYGEHDSGESSYIESTYTAGKPFYLRTLAHLAVSVNDNIALNYIMDTLGGIERFWPSIEEISGYINFTEVVTYEDASGSSIRGAGRTSCYDLSAYASSLYYSYISNSELYQPLINDLYYSEKFTPFSTSFGEDANILHISGRNEAMHAYTDVAIIDCEEPIVLVINCECSSYERANEIMTDLSYYLAQYISSCHTN